MPSRRADEQHAGLVPLAAIGRSARASHLSRAEQSAAGLVAVTLATVTAAAQHDLDVAAPAAEYAQCRWRYHATFPTLAAKGRRRIMSVHASDPSALRSTRQASTETAEKKRCGTSKAAD